ncbi:RecB family exonuclease [Helicobacter mustelae]|uniref:PD-(D/E)XK endonuclease-like domain-containing protein n=1 Tax=Helicobacter mustelae (strain ATCC 43772 / CCUG 25715 / CIP 103759 / LMG 18044 / NCTC 12198 / R85-136P) TaxID=679897 RepID=D3UH60_HELM1|nr:PD-(D/E)XK nuclease family protein [Helicobacter mustelae]CBG39832.1 putative hypothetical protein [Helicobacter mustelae 12198]SQH71342.1 exonuclease [Helicobacter mustelae]
MKDQKLYVFSSNRAVGEFYLRYEGGFAPRAMGAYEFFEFFTGVKDRKKAPQFVLKILLLQTLYAYKNTHKLLLFDKSFLAYLEGMKFLQKFFDELLLHQKSIKDIQDRDIYEDYAEHLQILEEIYEGYEERLGANKFYSKYYAQDYEIFTEMFVPFEGIEFHLEGMLSKSEQRVLFEIAKQKQLVLHFDCDVFNRGFFDFLDLALESNMHYALDLGQKKILHSHSTKIPQNPRLYAFHSRIAQVSFVLDKALEWLKQGRENVALITPSEDFVKYLRVLDVHRNFNFAMGIDIKQTSYYQAFIQEEIGENVTALRSLCEALLKEHPEFQQEIHLFHEEFFAGLDEIKGLMESFCIEQIWEFYQMELESLKLSDKKGGKIPVYGMLETRGMSFDAIIIVDFNEEKIFNFDDSDMFLNTKIRKSLGIPTLMDHKNLQKHYYYQLIKNAKEVDITYVKDDKPQALHFLSSIVDVLPGEFDKSIFYFDKKPSYVEDDFFGEIPQDFVFSASSLRTFFACKRRFFLRYIKGLRDVSQRDFSAQNLLHESLEKAYNAHPNDVIGAQKEFYHLVHQASLQDPMQKFASELMVKNMDSFWKQEREHYQKYRFYAAEYGFEAEILKHKFSGKIDRVDYDEESASYVVVDYKFGKKIHQSINENTSDFQLILYAMALESEGKSVEACLVYDIRGEKKISVNLEEGREILQERIKELDGEMEFTQNFKECHYCEFKMLCNQA